MQSVLALVPGSRFDVHEAAMRVGPFAGWMNRPSKEAV